MSKLLNVLLRSNNQVFAKCDYMTMDLFAPSILRYFTFINIKFLEKIDLFELEIIQITILYSNKYDSKIDNIISDFELVLKGNKHFLLESKNWKVYGQVKYMDYDKDYLLNFQYRQGVVDTFNLWQKKQDINWAGLSLNSYLKKDYIHACLIYSGVQKIIIERDIYEFDMRVIREPDDFFFYAGRLFFGEKGYMGWSLYPFQDCLLTIYHERGYCQDKTILFTYTEELFNEDMILFLEEVKKRFIRFEFQIKEYRRSV